MKLCTGFYETEKDRVAWQKEHAPGYACSGDSRTVQADAKDADINVIMERYARTGQFPGLSRVPSFGDFDGVSDFREALHVLKEAEDAFMSLPAKVRGEFDNDAVKFVEFCDRASADDLVAKGILRKEVLDADAEREQEVKEKPTSGQASRSAGGAASAARREPGKPSGGGAGRGDPEGGGDH